MRGSSRSKPNRGLSRRTFLKLAGGAIGALAIGPALSRVGIEPLGIGTASEEGGLDLERFVDPLPIPAVMQPTGRDQGATYYEIRMVEFPQKLHRDLPPTVVWGYNGTFPGPTIETRMNERVRVKWINDLPEDHVLPVDTTIPGAEYPDNPYVRNVVHLHGGHVAPESDGHPEDWFTPGQHALYEYPNSQPGATLWYHDHALGITRLNVYAGLAGFYIIRNPREKTLRLPGGNYEIPVVIQDRSFSDDGSLFYPETFMPEFFGDTAVVNGKVWPHLAVEPRRYRFRLLNGSTGRFYNLQLLVMEGGAPSQPGPPLHQIGTDGGLLPAPIRIDGRLLLAPAERADVIIDFSGFEGQSLLLHNDAKTPFISLDQTEDEVPLPEIMRFDVSDSPSSPDTSILPRKLATVPKIPEQSAIKVRDLTLEMKMVMRPGGGMRMQHLLNGLEFHDPVTEKPQLGTTEIWRLINVIDDAHPVHLHLVQFQILDRQPFDVEQYMASGELVFTGDPVPPDPNEDGWKDTVRANPGEVTRIIAHFGDFAGQYVWHCHILEHEDFEMMRPLEVVPGR